MKKVDIKHIVRNKVFYMIFYSLLIISIIALLFKVPVSTYIIFVLLGFGWSLFFFKKRFNILEHFFLSFGVFTAIFIVFTIIFAILNIPLTTYIGLAFFLVSNAVFASCKVFKNENINLKINKYDYLILFLFISAFVAKVISIKDFQVPGLHDPITHAFFSKRIVDTGLINYFYSPGLHIVTAFSNMFNSFTVARQVLYVTNFFNAYIGVVVYLFIKQTCKKDFVWSLVAALLFSLWYFPATFFVNAGKNALVVALVILFLFFFVVEEYRKNNDVRIAILANIVLASIFLIHYPTAIWACTYLSGVFFVDFKKEKFRTVFLGLGVFLGVGWMLKTYGYRLLESAESAIVSQGALYTIAPNSFNRLVDFVKNIWITCKFNNSLIGKLLAVFSIFGFLILLFKSISKKEYRVLVFWFFLTVSFAAILYVFSVTPLFIVLETFWISLFLFEYLFVGVFINFLYHGFKKLLKVIYLKIFEIIFIFCFIVITILFSIKMYKTFYQRNSMHNVIEESDIKSFEWINGNIPDEEKFLINANGNDGLVFSTDGGGWLEVFTDNEISMPFYEFSSKRTDENVDLYNDLKKDVGNCKYIKDFIDRGYNYYYQGSRPIFDKRLAEQNELIDSGRFELLFDGGESEVYRLIPCENNKVGNISE